MNGNLNSLLLGNIAFNKDEYADAIRCYTAAGNSNSKSMRSDAFLNRALAHKKLGLTHHARNDFSEAVHSPYKNILVDSVKKKVLLPDDDQVNDIIIDNNSNYGNLFQQFHSNNSYIHSHYNYNNHMKIKNSYKNRIAPKDKLEKCFTNTDFFLECSKIQDIRDQNSFQFSSSFKRRAELNRISDFITTLQDSQCGIALGTNSPNYWLYKARASFTLQQLETALNCINYFEQRKQQNLGRRDTNQASSNYIKANALTTINALKKLYTEKTIENKRNPNSIASAPENYFYEINNNRLFRISFNITHGRISEVLYDDPTHPLVLFATRELPMQLEKIIINRSPFLSQLLDGIRETLYFKGSRLYRVLKPDLGIEKSVQEKWYQTVKGVPRLILQIFPQITGINARKDINDENNTNSKSDSDDIINYSSSDSSYNDSCTNFMHENVQESDPSPFGNDDKSKIVDSDDQPSTNENLKKKNPIPKNFASKLLEQSLSIGIKICPERASFRDAALAGLATLEISQLITNWILRKNVVNESINENYENELEIIENEAKEAIYPSFDLILSIVSSWLRFSYPIFPIFPSRSIPHSTEKVEIVSSGTPSNQAQFDTYGPLFMRKIVESLISHKSVAGSFSQFGGAKIDVKRPETVLSFTKTPINVILEPSKARLYLKPQCFGSYDFGIVIGEDEIEKDKKYDELPDLWESIINSSSININDNKNSDLNELIANLSDDDDNDDNILKLIFKFWFDWTLAQPLLSFSTAAGQIVFASLLHAFFGLIIDDGMPVDSDLKLKSFLASSNDEFVNEMLRNLVVKYAGYDFESVIDTLPDMQYRTAILLDIPDDDK